MSSSEDYGGGTVISLAEEYSSDDSDDDSSVLDGSIEEFFRELMEKKWEPPVRKAPQLPPPEKPSRPGLRRRRWLLLFTCLLVALLATVFIGSRRFSAGIVEKEDVVESPETSSFEGDAAIAEAENSSRRPLLFVSPGRLATSVLLGSLSFMIGIPGIPGLCDNAVVGVLATLAPLFDKEKKNTTTLF